MSRTVPICLNVDDGGVIDTYFFHDLRNKHEFLVPPAFVVQFGKLCEQYGVKGKFSIVPIPCGLGRLDEADKVNMVPADNVAAFVDYARKYIAPRFSIAPELLTHFLAWDLQHGGKTQYCEDTYIARLNAEEIAEYVTLGLQILDNIGLTPSGVSSPWQTGIDNEENYARGIGLAFKRIFNADNTFYFLLKRRSNLVPEVMCNTPETGRVVAIPGAAHDVFWQTQNPFTMQEAHLNAKTGVDSLLSEDGKSGDLLELYESNSPLILFAHWMSLYSEGRAVGLQWLEVLLQRIKRVFGNNVEWVTFDELSGMY